MFTQSQARVDSDIIFSSDLEEAEDLGCFHKQIDSVQLVHQTEELITCQFVLKHATDSLINKKTQTLLTPKKSRRAQPL